MEVRFKKYTVIISIFLTVMTLSGCTLIEKFEKKLGIRNEYFDFIDSNKIKKITVQSNRDKGFKFIVTEDSAIDDMYILLAKSKASETKTELEPDFIFEFYVGEEIRRFYYVVGATEGNFYNDNEAFTVSKRLDEGIIQNMSFIRMPREFDYVYYNSILEVLEVISKKADNSKLKVGINIQGDVDCLKYVYSIELEGFLDKAKKIVPNVDLTKNNEQDFDIVLNIKNRGYDSTNFKTLISVDDKINKVLDEYYVTAKNVYKEWDIKVSDANQKPNDW